MLCIYDTETTGLWKDGLDVAHPNQPKIASLSALRVKYNGVIEASMDVIVKPDGWTIPEAAAKVHGITTERAMAEGIPLLEAMRQFNDIVKGCDRMIGHNEAFDNKVIRHALKIIKRKIDLPEKRSCTMMMAKNVVKKPPKFPGADYAWPNLQETYVFLFGREFQGAHTSLADVNACMEIYRELKNRGVNDEEPVKSRSGMKTTEWDEFGRSFVRLKELIGLANDNAGRLSDFERDFVLDLEEKVEKYGDRTYMSDKQWKILERIEEKVV